MIRTAPGRLPIVGHILSYARDPLGFLGHCHRLGPYVAFQFGRLHAVMLTEPELIEEVFVTKAKHFGKDVYAQDLKQFSARGCSRARATSGSGSGGSRSRRSTRSASTDMAA